MKLSLIFELLLIFVLLAFAASKSVRKQKNDKKGVTSTEKDDKPEDNSINSYCKCSETYCNCCREFQLPLVNLDGPGCASLMYLNGDKMSVSLSFGKRVITNRTLSSRKPSPVCMPLPGGLSKFCGRVYNIARVGEDFRACLSLELQSKSTVEAAVRVSCFMFGPRGVNSEPADPLPLVPQDEKIEDDDDDDDDDDDFGFDDDDDEDDDDDDDEGDAVNDVESADYTGFSLLGEDILGDLFGSSSGKKSNKHKKKQAPPVSTTSTTTTTRRPRPSRRPTRRPATRTTTPRTTTTRTTTVRIRPVTRRPTRRPSRRPGRPRPTRPGTQPTTPASSIVTEASSTTVTTTQSTIPQPTLKFTTPDVHTTERNVIIENDHSLEPVVIISQKPVSTLSTTTTKTVTLFDDPLEMSLAHITGQLSVMPVTAIVTSNAKDSSMSTVHDEMNYEKIETITPKAPTTVKFSASSEEAANDDIVQIVQNLDSQSEENVADKDETRSHKLHNHYKTIVTNDYYEGLSLPKKKHRNNNFDYEDLDVLGLTEMGKAVGNQLGIFNKNKGNVKNKKENKVRGNKKRNNDYDDILGLKALGETLGLSENNNKNSSRKNRSRQNKMMRGDWSQV